MVGQARTGMDVAFIAMLFLTSFTGIALVRMRGSDGCWRIPPDTVIPGRA
jgi:hypothetical protein